MTLTPWKKLHEEVIADNNGRWQFVKALFLAPGNLEREYYFVRHPGAVMVIGINDDGTLPMVRQVRPVLGCESLEFAAGGRGKDDVLTAAQREFAEEVKMKAQYWEHVGQHTASPGMSTEVVDSFIAWGLTPTVAEQDDTEEFEHVTLTVDAIEEAIHSGGITDGMCISAWHQAKPRVLEIIDQLRDRG